MPDPLIGRTLKEAYRIDRLLADGGMSRVYLGEQLSLSRQVVIKVLLPGFNNEDFIQLFLREARINSQIHHPNIVSVIDFGRADDGLTYLVMEYLNGITLDDIVGRQKGLPLTNIVWLMEQLCSAVHAAHKMAVVHRDLKPNNVMVAQVSGGTTLVKVLDFGISKPLSEDDLKHTRLGMVMGTPGYLAPEQIEGRRDIDHRADVYALGALLHYMITGKRPYSGASREIIMDQQLNNAPPRLTRDSVHDPECLVLQAVVDKAMAIDREQRYAGVRELWLDLLAHAQQFRKTGLAQESSDADVSGYQFVYQGRRDAGVSPEQIRQHLQQSLKFSDKQLAALLSGKRVVVRKNLSRKDAQRFADLFSKAGAPGLVEEMPNATRILPQQAESPLRPGSLPTAGLVEPLTLSAIQRTLAELPATPAATALSGTVTTTAATAAAGTPGNVASSPGKPHKRRWIAAMAFAFAGLGALAVYLYQPWRYAAEDLYYSVTQGEIQQRGLSAERIRLGMSAAFSGSAKELGRAMRIGVETYLKEVNAQGGIHGRTLELYALNDGYEPERAKANLQTFLDPDNGVLALLGNVGTPTTEAILPQVLASKTLMFGTFSGAELLRQSPPDRYVFNYRASYAEETAAIIHDFVKVRELDPKRIGVFYQHDGYGWDGLSGVVSALGQYQVREEEIPAASYRRNSLQLESAVDIFKPHLHTLQGIVVVATYTASAEFTRQIRSLGYHGIIANVSFVGSRALSDQFQEWDPKLAKNVLVSQVVPPFDSYATGVLRYREALQRFYPNEQPDLVSLEGYIAARIFCEGLVRAGRHFDTETLVNALESIQDLDLGIGTQVSFSLSNHQASHRVWALELDPNGSFKPLRLRPEEAP